MSTAALVPVEAYLQMTEKPYREYRDGVLYPKAMPTSYIPSFNGFWRHCCGIKAWWRFLN